MHIPVCWLVVAVVPGTRHLRSWRQLWSQFMSCRAVSSLSRMRLTCADDRARTPAEPMQLPLNASRLRSETCSIPDPQGGRGCAPQPTSTSRFAVSCDHRSGHGSIGFR